MKYLPLLAILFLSCEKSVEPSDPNMNGRWTYPTGGIDVILTQNGESVSGSGVRGGLQCTVTGLNQYPKVTLYFTTTSTSIANGNFVNDNSIKFLWTTDPQYEIRHLTRQ